MPEAPTGMYNEHGQVENEDLAHKMANIEKPYHEKTLGIIPASKGKIAKGEQKAEQYLQPEGVEINPKDVPSEVRQAATDYLSKYGEFDILKHYIDWDITSIGSHPEPSVSESGMKDGSTKYIIGGSVRRREYESPLRYYAKVEVTFKGEKARVVRACRFDPDSGAEYEDL